MRHTLFIVILLFAVGSVPAFSQNWQFAVKIGGVGNESGKGVALDKEGNSYVVGAMNTTTVFDTISLFGGNRRNIFIAKYNSVGRVVWAKIIASSVDSLYDVVNINAISLDGLGNIFITGNYLGGVKFFGQVHSSIGSSEIYLAKLANDGSLTWLRTAGGNGVGSFNQNSAYALSLDGSGNCYLTGRYFTTAKFDTITLSSSLPNEFFVAKYNSDGHVVWARTGSGDFGTHTGLAIATDSTGSSYVAGSFFGHLVIDGTLIDAVDAEQKMFLIKYSSDGKTLWAKEIGSGGYYGGAEGVAIDKNGNVHVTGFFRAGMNFGTTQLSYYNSIIVYALFIVKYDKDGNYIWAKQTDGSNQNAEGYAITSDAKGNSYISGNFALTTSFGSTTLTNDSGSAAFITKVDAEGNFLWAIQTIGKGYTTGNAIVLSPKAEVIVVGSFSDTIGFGSKTLKTSGGSDVFIAKLLDPSEGVEETRYPISSSICYPNPVSTILHTSKKQNNRLFDVLGRKVIECIECDRMNIENIPAGAYYMNGNLVLIEH